MSASAVEAFGSLLWHVKDGTIIANLLAEEVSRLANVFQDLSQPTIPEMPGLLQSFRRYCMGKHTFDERDFRSTLEVRS